MADYVLVAVGFLTPFICVPVFIWCNWRDRKQMEELWGNDGT